MTFKSLFFFVFSCVSTLMLASGCGVLKNMDEMHDATNDMNNKMEVTNKSVQSTGKTTEHMAGKMDHMSNTTDGMAGDVARTACYAWETYTALRQGNTLIARNGDNARGQMEAAGSIEEKIFYAGAYFKGFEFQIYNCENSIPDTNGFYIQAAEEFTRILPSYLTTDRSQWSVSPTSTDPHFQDLYALSVTLQELNTNMVGAYKAGLLPQGEEPKSLLELIKNSLTRKVELAAHPEKATLADHEFLANEALLVQLIQVRMNFLAAMSLAKVSSIQSLGLLGKLGILIRGLDTYLYQMGQDLNFEEIRHLTRFLYGSNEARDILNQLHVKPIIDQNIYKAYSHLKIVGVDQKKIARPTSTRELAFNNTQDAIQEYLEQYAIFFNKKPFRKIAHFHHPELIKN